LKTLRARTISLHGIHDLAEMVDVRYRVLRGDPERVAALIPAGQPVRESSKSSSKNAEQQRRRELEAGFHNVEEVRQQRIRRLSEIVDEYLVGYRLRYRSATFAEYALGHVSRLIGAEMVVDIDEAGVLRYQEERLREKAGPKINQRRGSLSPKDAWRFRRNHSREAPQEEAAKTGGPKKVWQSIRH
jgi:hypothetical protein